MRQDNIVKYNLYCDESCHLPNDHEPVMALGCVWIPADKRIEIAQSIRQIKQEHSISSHREIKWNKVSPAQLSYYEALVNYFFDCNHLHFRGVVIPDKSILNHGAFGHDHDTWYYKMYYTLLKTILSPNHSYDIFIDIKDNWGSTKIKKLHEVLCNNAYDFSREIIRSVSQVRSHEISQLQLADLLLGALRYENAGLKGSSAKIALVRQIRARSGYTLRRTTLLREDKFNILIWQGVQSTND